MLNGPVANNDDVAAFTFLFGVRKMVVSSAKQKEMCLKYIDANFSLCEHSLFLHHALSRHDK